MKTRPASAALAAILAAVTMLLTADPAAADAARKQHIDEVANARLASGFSSTVDESNLKRTGDLNLESWWGNDSSWNRYSYVLNNPVRFVDPSGETVWDVVDPVLFAVSVGNLWRKALTGEQITAGDNWQVAGDAVGMLPIVPAIGTAGRLAKEGVEHGADVLNAADTLGDGASAGKEVVQRWMSKAELKNTKETGLLRGGREGTHYVTDAANSSAKRARQRLSLQETPDVRVTMEVPAGSFSAPSRVNPKHGMPGGGMERTATGNIPVEIVKTDGRP